MKFVQQEDKFGCGLACIAMLSGKSYGDIKELASDEAELTSTNDLIELAKKVDVSISSMRRTQLVSFERLTTRAILSLSYEDNTQEWHWVVFERRNNGDMYIYDPEKKKEYQIKTNDVLSVNTYFLSTSSE